MTKQTYQTEGIRNKGSVITDNSHRWRLRQCRGSAAARLTPCWSPLGERRRQGRGSPSLVDTPMLSWHSEEAGQPNTSQLKSQFSISYNLKEDLSLFIAGQTLQPFLRN